MTFQYLFIIISEPDVNITEILIWSILNIFYTGCYVVSDMAKIRLQANNPRNLKLLTCINIVIILVFWCAFIWIFNEAGLFLMVFSSYQPLVILIESINSLCTLHFCLQTNEVKEIKFRIIELLIKSSQ